MKSWSIRSSICGYRLKHVVSLGKLCLLLVLTQVWIIGCDTGKPGNPTMKPAKPAKPGKPVDPAIITKLKEGLAGHWKLNGDCKDSSGNANHGQNQAADLTAGGPFGNTGTAARFDGKQAYIKVPDSKSLSLGNKDFSIALWVKTDKELDDVIGDLLSKYDPQARKGFNFNIKHHAGVTTSQTNYRNLHFGIDDNRTPTWQDCGRPGNAVQVYSMAVHQDNLYVGTYEFGAERFGHVYRYGKDGRWIDCGSPDKSNTVMSLAVYKGHLFAGTGYCPGDGSLMPLSPNDTPGGRVYRYLGNKQWAEYGKLPGGINAVNALAVYKNQLYSSPYPRGQKGVFRLEKGLDGWNWVDCGSPGGRTTISLCVWNGDLYSTSGTPPSEVFRYRGGTEWESIGLQEKEVQTFSTVIFRGNLHVGSWPNGSVFRYEGGRQWTNSGRLGKQREIMGMAVYNGKLYCGTLPSAQVYRYDGDDAWALVGQIDKTPNIKYRRVWTMAVYKGKLFCGTLPSGHVHSMEAGKSVTMDRELAPGWKHIVAVKGSQSLKLYVDGRIAASSSLYDPDQYNLSNDKPLLIGFGSHDYFKGSLSDLRLYKRALSDIEVAALPEIR